MARQTTFSDFSKTLKLLIFDLDGTLVDSSKPMGEAFNYTLKEVGIKEFSQEETEAFIGTPLSALFMRIMERPMRDTEIERCIEIYRKKYLEIFLPQSFLYEGVAEIIPELAEKFTITMATTKRSDIANMTLDHFGLSKYFELILGFDNVSKPKPSPEIILKTLDELNIKNEEAMMVGDSLYDLDAARSAGVASCMVTYGFESKEKLLQKESDLLIDSFLELGKLLDNKLTD